MTFRENSRDPPPNKKRQTGSVVTLQSEREREREEEEEEKKQSVNCIDQSEVSILQIRLEIG